MSLKKRYRIRKIARLAKKAFTYLRAEETIFNGFRVKEGARHSNYSTLEPRVAFYAPAGLNTLYQFKVWEKTLIKMAEEGEKTVIVCRSLKLYTQLSMASEFPVVFARRLVDLSDFYSKSNIKVILYASNGVKNFQSLSFNGIYHVHINHGESEKSSMYSNQSKAYDSVFVVGDAAIDRYKNNLLNFTKEKYIKVGRPQLDYIEKIDLDIPSDKKVILYAPTWEGTHKEMNYSSVSEPAIELISQLLLDENYFVLYRPHPSTGEHDVSYEAHNKKIIKMVDESPAGKYIPDGDINAIFEYIDLAVFDNSSVIIDYLKHLKPYFITNKFHVDQSAKVPEIAKPEWLVELKELPELKDKIGVAINNVDTDNLLQLKKRYLGDYKEGESTQEFVMQVKKLLS